MGKLVRHALTYFASAGIALLLAGGVMLLLLIDAYNATRTFNILHATSTIAILALGEALIIAGVTIYVASRKGYTPPVIPQLPEAETIALIPAYNEEKNVGNVVREAKRYVDLVVVADDGSRDRTAEEALKAGAVVVRHQVNMGYGATVKTLLTVFLASKAKYAVQLDADGQHDPSEIPLFLKALKDGAEIAIGNRFTSSQVPLYRKVGIYVIRFLLSLMGVKVGDPENGYRAYTRKAAKTLLQRLDETWMGISSQAVYLAVKNKLKIKEVPTRVTYGPDTSTEMPLTHGLSIIWTIVWTWFIQNPLKTLALSLIAFSLSACLYAYVIFLFNTTRYIRLAYTVLATLSLIISTILLSISITAISLKTEAPNIHLKEEIT